VSDYPTELVFTIIIVIVVVSSSSSTVWFLYRFIV